MPDIKRGVRTRLIREATHCALCGQGQPEDLIPHTQLAAWLEWTIDHIVPVSEGGTHGEHNLAVAHRICNQIRGARMHLDQLEDIAEVIGLPSVLEDEDIPLYAAKLFGEAGDEVSVFGGAIS